MTEAHTDRLRWPSLMKQSTARAYLDGMSSEKFRATVAPHLTPRMVGERIYYRKDELDAFILGPQVDEEVEGQHAPDPRELIQRVARDLAERKGRQARRREG